MKRRTGLKNGTKVGVKKGGGGNNNNNTNTNNKKRNGKKKGGKSNKSKDAAKTPQDLDMQMDTCIIYTLRNKKYF